MIYWRILFWSALLIVAVIGIPFFGVEVLNDWLDTDASGWVQTGIALISFPVIVYELDQIRQIANRKPQIEVGLANIRDLPFSKVRGMPDLPARVNVSSGYAHFYIILRNRGTAPARYVKIYVEHVNREQEVFHRPLVKVSEYSETKPSFVAEHNFDFVFRAGTDWIINQNDIEQFGFHITTNIGTGDTYKDKHGNEQHIMENPSSCEVILDCTIWAEGLSDPIKTTLVVNIVNDLNEVPEEGE